MIDFNYQNLRSVLINLENEQETNADRDLMEQLLRDFIVILESDSLPQSLPEAIAVLKVNNLENQNLQRGLEQRITELDSLRQISSNLTSNMDLRQVLRSILVETLRVIQDVQDTYIYLYDNGRLSMASSLKSDEQENDAFPALRPQGLTYTVARLGKIISVPDMSTHPLFMETEWTGSVIAIPLKIGSRVVGVMTVRRQPTQEFSESETRLLMLLADHAAMGIESARLHNLIDEQAHLDQLTGLHNRRSLDERLENEILRYNAVLASQGGLGAQKAFGLLMMDLDEFKNINETYGHLAGDYVLREITHSITQALRKTDFLARYGGDELAVVISDTDQETARLIAQRIQDFVSKTRFNLPNIRQKTLSVTMGAALFPDHASSVSELIEAVEDALTQAKEQGTGSLAFSTHTPDQTPNREAPQND